MSLALSCGVAAADGFERGARNAEIFRCNDESPHAAVANFGDLRFPGKRDLIQATGTMNYERAGRAELRQRGCNRGRLHPRRKTPSTCASAPAGLVSGPRRLKTVAASQFAAARACVARCRVRRGGEQKTDANFMHRAAGHRERQINVYAKGLENIRGAAAGADGTVAMLGNASTRRRRDNRRGGWIC